MAGITIPAKIHADMLKKLKVEYEAEFGSIADDINRSYTRDEFVRKYANDIKFWRSRIPDIMGSKQKPSIENVCLHMITSNAVSNMEKMCKERGIYEDVLSMITT